MLIRNFSAAFVLRPFVFSYPSSLQRRQTEVRRIGQLSLAGLIAAPLFEHRLDLGPRLNGQTRGRCWVLPVDCGGHSTHHCSPGGDTHGTARRWDAVSHHRVLIDELQRVSVMLERGIQFPSPQNGLDDLPGLLGGREVLLRFDDRLATLDPDAELRQITRERLGVLVAEGR